MALKKPSGTYWPSKEINPLKLTATVDYFGKIDVHFSGWASMVDKQYRLTVEAFRTKRPADKTQSTFEVIVKDPCITGSVKSWSKWEPLPQKATCIGKNSVERTILINDTPEKCTI